MKKNKNGLRCLRGVSATMLATVALALSCTAIAAHARAPSVDAARGDDAGFACTHKTRSGAGIETVATTLAGVPAILRVPVHATRPPIILWHGFGPPASPSALMDALPLDEVPSVKVYLGLPLFGARAPVGGVKELIRRQKQDFAKLLFKPSVVGAAEELPAVVAALERRGCMTAKDRIGLFGFSAGGASALIALEQHKVAVGAAIVLNASTGLDASVAALERVTRQRYAWTPAARALGKRTDAIRHAADIARGNPPPALLIVQGADDTVLTPRPATALYKALLPWYENSPKRLRLQLLPGVSHGWTDAGTLAKLRSLSAAWFRHSL
jgi:dienelactone hydrolase